MPSRETSSSASVRVWLPKLTKFEKARVIGARALQLAMGARPLIDVSKLPSKDFVFIARQELLRGVLPFTIVRRLPNGLRELVPVSHLIEAEKRIFGEVSL
ncbi:MAG: DNA-directed RNA polymerase subunit K [Sulfolobales archaeon]|nr:DNA-directed RNA polymerase subunit K [Sulfolobales archaeon]MDW8009993.1 DNA-directed RNA polymerase subunit K [Sulfolobales archaeon]